MALDSNGIWSYEETDSEATASDLLNLLADSTSNTVADLQAQVDSKQPLLGDTGWIDATLSNAFVKYNASSLVQYRRIGSQVQIRGIVKPANATIADSISGSAGYEVIFTLPAGFRTSAGVDLEHTICQGSRTNRWMLQVNPDGQVWARRYGPEAAEAEVWMPFSHTFFIG